MDAELEKPLKSGMLHAANVRAAFMAERLRREEKRLRKLLKVNREMQEHAAVIVEMTA